MLPNYSIVGRQIALSIQVGLKGNITYDVGWGTSALFINYTVHMFILTTKQNMYIFKHSWGVIMLT